MTKDKQALIFLNQQKKIIIKLFDKIPDNLQSDFKKISDLNAGMIEIFKNQEAKNV